MGDGVGEGDEVVGNDGVGEGDAVPKQSLSGEFCSPTCTDLYFEHSSGLARLIGESRVSNSVSLRVFLTYLEGSTIWNTVPNGLAGLDFETAITYSSPGFIR